MIHVHTHMNQCLHMQFQNKFNSCTVQTIQTYPAVTVNILLNTFVTLGFNLCSRSWQRLRKSQEQYRTANPALSGTSIDSLHSGAVNSSAVSSPERGHAKVWTEGGGAARYRSSVQGVWTASLFTVQSVYSLGTAHSPKCYYTPLYCDSVVRTGGYCVLCTCTGFKYGMVGSLRATAEDFIVWMRCIF